MGFSRLESSTKPWSVNETEIAYNLEKTVNSYGRTQNAKWKINIPKLMPLIPIAPPKDVKEPLPRSIFCNAAECMPSIQSQIVVQNYLIVDRPPNRSFRYAWKKHGMKHEVNIQFRNIDKINVENTLDNSSPRPI